MPPIKEIKKRSGELEKFNPRKIENAITKAFLSLSKFDKEAIPKITKKVAHLMEDKFAGRIPSVEQIQDLVETTLMLEGYTDVAKAYILYRSKRAELRRQGLAVPEHVKKLAQESGRYFKNQLAEFVFYRTYSRWVDEENRRETWIETVDRYMAFMKENLGKKLSKKEYDELREAILRQDVMPSMRLLQFAGPAARKTNICAYNCSFIAPSKLQDFGDIMYILMCGSGVGFSVESRNVQALPQIQPQTGKKLATHVIADSKEGWSDALVLGMKTWFAGKDMEFDYSKLRPAGARLKTMGGRSSGPDPLRAVLIFTKETILKKQGRRLTNLNVHDIVCKIGEVVVSGGVRRSALISLSDLDDQEMRDAKKGQFYLNEPQRSMANNSAVYLSKPGAAEFLDEWVALMKSGSGERGIFNRGSLAKMLPQRRIKALHGDITHLGTNPCGEIILQSRQFCNLSEVVARADDDEKSLVRKARLATILGTYQSTLTHFPYISPEWKKNCEKERLLGVSITGQWDSKAVRDAGTLNKMRLEALKTNQHYAKKFGINASTCITCVKPSGTVSQTVDSSSGMHPRHAQYYIRRIRISATDPLFKMMKDQGVPYHPEVGQMMGEAHTYVFEFPVKAPKGSIFKNDLSAIEQLKYWQLVKQNYTEHNPSITISVGDEEWIEVASWIHENWDIVGGLSFLPREKHVYRLAPYEDISKEEYEAKAKAFPEIDFSKIVTYEAEDDTDVAKELACVSGVCEIV
ncbi:ribonucleoside-triphosphate reductase [Candidatus Azambacteria bacterium]|nr:ribonucleoside-triphosphate reductase [Candidatus Azambacteria bacterium]